MTPSDCKSNLLELHCSIDDVKNRRITEDDIEVIKSHILTTRAILSERQCCSREVSRYYEAGKTICEAIRYLISDNNGIRIRITSIDVRIDAERHLTRFDLKIAKYQQGSVVADDVPRALRGLNEKYFRLAKGTLSFMFTNANYDDYLYTMSLTDDTNELIKDDEYKASESVTFVGDTRHGVVSYSMNFPIPSNFITMYQRMASNVFMNFIDHRLNKGDSDVYPLNYKA